MYTNIVLIHNWTFLELSKTKIQMPRSRSPSFMLSNHGLFKGSQHGTHVAIFTKHSLNC